MAASKTTAPTQDSCIPLHQQASFDCENGTLSAQQPSGKSDQGRQKKCVISCSVAAAFCAAGLIGFFTLGPVIQYVVPSSRDDSPGNTALSASASFLVPNRVDIAASPRRSPMRAQAPVPRAPPAKAYGGSAAVLKPQRAPPAPPPAGPGRGDGGGDGEGKPNHMRLIGGEQQAQILDDWIARTRLYKMSSQFGGDEGVSKRHEDALKALEEIREFKVTRGIDKGTHTLHAADGLKLLFALHDHEEQIVGLAAMGVNEKGLTVKNIAIHPEEVNNADSVARLRVVLALRLVAQTMKVPLDTASLDNSLDASEPAMPHGRAGAEKSGAEKQDVVVPDDVGVDGGTGVEKKAKADK